MFGISKLVEPPCSISPMCNFYSRARNDATLLPSRILQFNKSKSLGFGFRLSDGFKDNSLVARVSAPLGDATFHEDGDEFDTKNSCAGNPLKSMSFAVRVFAVVFGFLTGVFRASSSWISLFPFQAWRTSHWKIQRYVENDNLM